MRGLRIGELARQAGVNLQTIHYYERRGLIPEAPRTTSNYRIYSEDDARRVHFIKHAQKLGFSLKEIKEMLSLRAAPRAKCADVLKQAEKKISDIDERISALQRMRRALSKLKSECRGDLPASQCPILHHLDAD
jgi:MerR family mercuric resistance operon transcriptional regulator